jgi:AraC-like DNA-binding protein
MTASLGSYVGSAMVASLVRSLGDRARGLGLERIAGVKSLDALADPTVRLRSGVDDEIFATAARGLRMPWLGVWFGAEVADERSFGALGYLVRHAPTVGESFARVLRYHRLFTSAEPTEIHTGRSTIRIVEGAESAALWSPAMGDAVIATWLSLIRRWTGVAIAPVTVELAYPRPVEDAHHREHFGEALRFGAPAYALELPSDILTLPLLGADPMLGDILERHAQELLGLGADHSGLVRDVYAAFEAGHDELSAVARALRVQPRTLQRQLADLGLTLRELRDQHRRQRAERLLADPRRSLKEVAVSLGFADATAFRRAFVRWTGRPPREQVSRAS